MIVFIIVLFSCNSITKKNASNDILHYKDNEKCTKLFKRIPKKFQIHDKYFECLQYNEKIVLEIIHQKECLIGLKKENIMAVFDTPTAESDNQFIYDLYINCNSSKPASRLYSLNFTFENQKLTDIILKEEFRLF
ncbi:MAG: hypothetical protein IPN79_09880 [Saprospiraceae bacterium]|nr:hypothetical protein [Saprospiraceae bacterium]